MRKIYSLFVLLLMAVSMMATPVTRTVWLHIDPSQSSSFDYQTYTEMHCYSLNHGDQTKSMTMMLDGYFYATIDIEDSDLYSIYFQQGSTKSYKVIELSADAISFTIGKEMKDGLPNPTYTNPTGTYKISMISESSYEWNYDQCLLVESAGNQFALRVDDNTKSKSYTLPYYGQDIRFYWYDPDDNFTRWFQVMNSKLQTVRIFDPQYCSYYQRYTLHEDLDNPKIKRIKTLTVNADDETSTFNVSWTADEPIQPRLHWMDDTYEVWYEVPNVTGNSASIHMLVSSDYTIKLASVADDGLLYDTQYEYKRLNAAEMTVNALITPDCGFDKEDGYWLRCGGDYFEMTPNPSLGNYWYTGTIPYAAGNYYREFSIVQKTGGSYGLSTNSCHSYNMDCYVYVNHYSESNWYLSWADANNISHDYTIQNVTIKDGTTDYIDITIQPKKDKAYLYYVTLYYTDDSYYEGFTIYDIHHQQLSHLGSDKEFYAVISAADEIGTQWGAPYKTGNFHINAERTWLESNLSATETAGKWKLEWQIGGETPANTHITILGDEGELLYDEDDQTSGMLWEAPQKNYDQNISAYLTVYDANGNVLEKSSTFFTVHSKDLGSIKVRALIQPTSQFPTDGDIWVYWYGSNGNKGGQKMTKDTEHEGWYEVTLTAVNAPSISRIHLTTGDPINDSWGSFEYTMALHGNFTDDICIETQYGNATEEKWYLAVADCDATVHDDYTFHNMKVETSNNGLTRTYTWETEAPVVEVYYYDPGIDENFYEVLIGKNSYTVTLSDYGNADVSFYANDERLNYGYDDYYDGDLFVPDEIPTNVVVRVNVPTDCHLDRTQPVTLFYDDTEDNSNTKSIKMTPDGEEWYTATISATTGKYINCALKCASLAGDLVNDLGKVFQDRDFLFVVNNKGEYYSRKLKAGQVCHHAYGHPELTTHGNILTVSLPEEDVQCYDKCILLVYDRNGLNVAQSQYTSKCTFALPRIGNYTLKVITSFKSTEFIRDIPFEVVNQPEIKYADVLINTGDSYVTLNQTYTGRYPVGTELTVVAETGSYYAPYWSDGNTDETRIITVPEGGINLTVYAKPLPTGVLHLTIEEPQHGTILNREAIQATEYHNGDEIYLVAVPDEGYRFVKWSTGDTENSISIYITDNTTISAIFEKDTPVQMVSLTVVAIGEGTTSIKTGKYKAGTKVKITATPKAGNAFLNWSSKSAVGTDNYEEKIIEIELTSDLVLAAIFADTNEDNRVTFRAKVADDQDSWGSVKAAIVTEVGGEKYTIPVENKTVLPKTDDGIKVKVSATPAAGYKFLNWNEDSDLNEAERTLTVKKNTTYTAYFKKNAEGVENVDVDVDVNKRIENGMLIITRDGKDYTITGQRL